MSENFKKRENYFNLFIEKDRSMKEYKQELNSIMEKLEKCRSKKYKKYFLFKKILKTFKKTDIIELNISFKTIRFGFHDNPNKLFMIPKPCFQEKNGDIIEVNEENFKKFCKKNNLEYINEHGVVRSIK